MKKFAPFLILFILALLIWNALLDTPGMSFSMDGDEIDGPLGALAALLFAGGGLLVAIVAMVLAAVVLAIIFAGVGIFVVAALVFAAAVIALAVSPLLLPLLIPVGIIWYLAGRNRRRSESLKQGPA